MNGIIIAFIAIIPALLTFCAQEFRVQEYQVEQQYDRFNCGDAVVQLTKIAADCTERCVD